jgi:uncharacterized repeat protein (TIGR03837 family)
MPFNAPRHPRPLATWDVFCRVVDNHGDVGVCWRLATDLAERGIVVRLWIDDAHALTWMAPGGRHGVEVWAWPVTDEAFAIADVEPATVVIEAFGCGLPDPCLRHIALAHQRSAAPVWINLEYLSAESCVERNHGLPSLQGSGLACGVTNWYFYPGFTASTGGLDVDKSLNVIDRIRLGTTGSMAAPASASASGTAGEIRIDADYIYVCTATNTWKRVAIATWP